VVATLPEAMPEARAEASPAAGIAPLLGLGRRPARDRGAAEAGEMMKLSAPVAPAVGRRRTVAADAQRMGQQAAARGTGFDRSARPLVATPLEAQRGRGDRLSGCRQGGAGRARPQSEIGGVRLGLADAASVGVAAAALRRLGEAILVEPMLAMGWPS